MIPSETNTAAILPQVILATMDLLPSPDNDLCIPPTYVFCVAVIKNAAQSPVQDIPKILEAMCTRSAPVLVQRPCRTHAHYHLKCSVHHRSNHFPQPFGVPSSSLPAKSFSSSSHFCLSCFPLAPSDRTNLQASVSARFHASVTSRMPFCV